LHGWVERLTWPELRSALVLLAMTFIALPIVPDDPIGPFGGFNPREVWLIAIALAGVSFIGYAAVKYFGARRGVLLAGLAGGLASSTAVTVTNARRAALAEGPPRLLAAGVAVASAVMFVRVGAIAAAINAELASRLAAPLLAATAAALAYAVAAVYWRRSGDDSNRELSFRNPFAFWSVLGFALFLGAVIVIGRVLGERLGAAGAIAGAAVVGLVDVDAITVSLSRISPQTLFPRDAALAVLAAVAANMVSKVAIGGAFGGRNFVLEVVIMSAGCLVVAAAAWWAMLAMVAP
jgi:uncharacterized membrane protein (DUF4010 family)